MESEPAAARRAGAGPSPDPLNRPASQRELGFVLGGFVVGALGGLLTALAILDQSDQAGIWWLFVWWIGLGAAGLTADHVRRRLALPPSALLDPERLGLPRVTRLFALVALVVSILLVVVAALD